MVTIELGQNLMSDKPDPNCEECKGTGIIEVQQMVPVSHFSAIYEARGPFFESQCYCVGEWEDEC